MGEQKKTDANDFSEEFMPVWKRYIISRRIILLIWILWLFSVWFLKIGEQSKIPILVITIGWVVYTFFSVRCPNCNGFLLGWGNWRVQLCKECQYCGAVLKNKGIDISLHPWVPWGEKTAREKTIIVIILTIIGVLTLLAIVGGIIRRGGIEYQHYDVPKSQCR